MSINDLVNEFADCVAAQSEAISRGDSSLGNKFAKRYVAAFDELRTYGDAGRDALADLFHDRRSSVRVMAATYLLRHCETQAVAILEKEAKASGIVAFGAAQALRRWKEGAWSLDPESP